MANNYFIDKRDQKKYAVIKINQQVWMAENLAYKPNNGRYWIYNNIESNLNKYGFLYDWRTANNICPEGWHLPTKAEFKILLENFDNEKAAFTALMTNGVSGFSALFAGQCYEEEAFGYEEIQANFWSATLDENNNYFGLMLFDKQAYIGRFEDISGFSVRCLKN
jgi:uncharacterized protein (TIGR02145 family)